MQMDRITTYIVDLFPKNQQCQERCERENPTS